MPEEDFNMPLSFKKKFIFALIWLCFYLVALELILRLFGFGYNLLYRLPKNADTNYTIFCIGESTTWGIGVDNPLKENYPTQLQYLLNKQFPGKNINCLFDQTIGQNTSEILLKLPFYIRKYQPRLMIFMVGINNWWNMDRSNILLFSRNRTISDLSLKVKIFCDRFKLFKLFKWVGLSIGLYKERSNYWFTIDNVDAYRDETAKLYGDNSSSIFFKLAEYDISEMVKICKAANIKVIISSYPMVSLGGLYYTQKKIAKKFDLPFVDNFILFRKIPNLNEYLWKDKWHPNSRGYTLVAQNIYNCIISRNLIE